MLRSTFRKLLAKEEANKSDVLINLNSIYCNFSSYILYLNYLSNRGYFLCFLFYVIRLLSFSFFLRLFYNSYHQLKAVRAGVLRLSRGNENFVTGKY